MLHEDSFEKAIINIRDGELNKLPSRIPPHTFSKSFERKMDRLISRDRRKRQKALRTTETSFAKELEYQSETILQSASQTDEKSADIVEISAEQSSARQVTARQAAAQAYRKTSTSMPQTPVPSKTPPRKPLVSSDSSGMLEPRELAAFLREQLAVQNAEKKENRRIASNPQNIEPPLEDRSVTQIDDDTDILNNLPTDNIDEAYEPSDSTDTDLLLGNDVDVPRFSPYDKYDEIDGDFQDLNEAPRLIDEPLGYFKQKDSELDEMRTQKDEDLLFETNSRPKSEMSGKTTVPAWLATQQNLAQEKISYSVPNDVCEPISISQPEINNYTSDTPAFIEPEEIVVKTTPTTAKLEAIPIEAEATSAPIIEEPIITEIEEPIITEIEEPLSNLIEESAVKETVTQTNIPEENLTQTLPDISSPHTEKKPVLTRIKIHAKKRPVIDKKLKSFTRGTAILAMAGITGLSVCIISVDSWSKDFFRNAEQFTPGYSQVHFQNSERNPESRIQNKFGDMIYSLTYIPDGFRLVEYSQTKSASNVIFKDSSNQNISFEQGYCNTSTFTSNKEILDFENIPFKTSTAKYFLKDGMHYLLWHDDLYYYMLSTYLPREEAIHIAESARLKSDPYHTLQDIPIDFLPSYYNEYIARENGDIIFGLGKPVNFPKLENFISDVDRKINSAVRVALFNDNSEPVIFDLQFENGQLFCVKDESRLTNNKDPEIMGEEYDSISLSENAVLLHSERFPQPIKLLSYTVI